MSERNELNPLQNKMIYKSLSAKAYEAFHDNCLDYVEQTLSSSEQLFLPKVTGSF